jgi:DNA modification methylase
MSNKRVKICENDRDKYEKKSKEDEESEDLFEEEERGDDDGEEEEESNNNNNNNEKVKVKEKIEKKPVKIDVCVVPPLSVLDVKQGYWKNRRKMWFDLYGISKTCAGRDENALKISKLLAKKQKSTSVFDPIVCEIAYKWFSGETDKVHDPFAGGAVRGLIACFMKRRYTGVDIRKEQVEENKSQLKNLIKAQAKEYEMFQPKWITEDAAVYVPDPCDLIFTCPPYFNLEKYSSLEGDLSNMTFDRFLQNYEMILKKACYCLLKNRFAVIVIGDVRDKDGMYLKLPERTIEIMERHDCKLYNKMILLQEPATAAMRALKYMNTSRKIASVHQNVYVFVKGDPKLATERLASFK